MSKAFGLVQPTLIQQIKKILDQYPDDGQILKELIQNAEDAGAKEVKFLYDKHSHGAEKLCNTRLAKFQGPALYAYNDAKFTNDDWDGIGMLCDSIKEKDPTKVGRFGLGFKSVFHMTDLPSVISGESVGIIDPEEKYFSDDDGKRSGRKWHLKQDREDIRKNSDQFAPYEGIFGCDDETFEKGSYKGTLFRLPLRQEASKFCDTIYSPKKIEGLLECFEKDAHLILLFLMVLEQIEVYERQEDRSKPRRLFHVGIRADCLEEVRKAREDFSAKVKQNASALSSGSFPEVKKTYPLTIETVHYNNEVAMTSEHSYVVTLFFSGSDVSEEIKSLMTNESLSYLPLVGVALPLQPQIKARREKGGVIDVADDDDDDDCKLVASKASGNGIKRRKQSSGNERKRMKTNADEPQGHLFCFLPLPLESKSLTGLPVHVNGFFALSQNRRHLKWPSADQDETLTDKSLLWNKGLLQDVLPKAYAELILHVISCSSRKDQRQMMTTSDVYSAWPDINEVDVKWQRILQPFFDVLLQSKILHTAAHGGGWCRVEDSILDDLKKSDVSRKIVIDLLTKTGINIVTAPAHVKTALQRYCTFHLQYVTPKIMRSRLKADPSCYAHLNHQDKILLLKFILSDSNFQDLHGLELLPLADGTFTTFEGRWDASIYIDSTDHPKSLLPGLQRMFLDTEVDDAVTEQLKNAVRKGHTQLRHFNKEAVNQHLSQTLPSDWLGSEHHLIWYPGSSNQLTDKWLKALWEYFAIHFAQTAFDLDAFVGLPLVPVTPMSNQSKVQLARIQRPSSLVLASFNGERIDESVCHVLKNLGLTIMEDLPEYIQHFPELVPSYANPASARGVLNAMEIIFRYHEKKSDFLKRMRDLPADKIRLFRTFLSRLSSLTPNELCLLQQLPLFETYVGHGEGQSRFVSIEEVKSGAPVDDVDLPDVPVFTDLLNLKDQDGSSRTLAQWLNILPITLPDFLKILLDDALREKYSEWEVDVLVKYTLERFGIFHGKDLDSIKQKLQCLSFVVCSDNSRKKPTELFNPEDDLLKTIFLDEDVFPKESYYSQPEVNAHLTKLGLKGEERVTTSQVLNSARMVNTIQNQADAIRKSNGILVHLNKNVHKFKKRSGSEESGLHQLSAIAWVPVVTTKPPTYPPALPLKKDDIGCFACPKDVKSNAFIHIVGSVKSVVDMQANPCPELCEYFKWNERPEVSDVITHLGKVASAYNVEEKPLFITVVKDIYSYLNKENTSEVKKAFQVKNLSNWVWNGDGFSSPNEISIESPSINLSPYFSSIPPETKDFGTLFISCGIKDKFNEEDLVNILRRVKKTHEERKQDQSACERDLNLVINILNKLKHPNGELFSKDLRERLLLPVDVEGNKGLVLVPVEECTYCDPEWRKEGYDLGDFCDEVEGEIKLLHRDVPISTAELLEVPTLMSRFLSAEELEMGESFGQSESLLDRLRGLLDGYTDGLSVPKELIQNADDAGATEVRFLYDERTNEDCMTRLIDEGMKECQGPALWANNDAVFSDEDFQNIVKLNAATKKEDSRKIGRFGLGFNSVYNLTDVPSFVSRDSIVILDPHTTYLGKGLRDKSKPGIKIRMEKKRLRKLENQFKPYNGIFGCDLRAGAQQKSYNGTLFRFPLRTATQAKKSEINPLYYDEKQVKELLGILFHGAESLLLFTQNVLRVTVYHLRNENTEAPQPVELFRISKSCSKVVHQLQGEVSLSNSVKQLAREDQEFVKQSSILKVSSSCMEKHVNQQDFSSSCRVLMKSSMIINCQCDLSDHGKEYLADVPVAGGSQVSWLVTSCMVSGKAFKMASTNKGLLPTAGVAAKLTDADAGKYAPFPITKPLDHRSSHQDSRCCHNGSVFCFLPLPIHSGLPVHINGCFAVSDNRRYLRERTEEDKTDQGAEWNDVLMKEVVCQTYISMLEDIRELSSSNGYTFHSLWPRCSDLQPKFYGLACQFYSFLSSNEPELFSDGRTWTSIQNVVFLEPAFRNEEPIGQIAFDVFKSHVKGTDTIVIDLPGDVFRSFERYELKQRIESMCYNKERFFREVFFPVIQSIDAVSRNKLVLYALDDTLGTLRELVRNRRCIPSSPLGNKLKYPKELLHNRGKAAQLFRSEDGRFPHGEEITSDERLATLKRLGMRDDDLEWEEVIERAESVKSLVPYQEALDRTKLILAFIDRKLDNDRQVNEDVQTRLQRVQFLPIMRRPEGFPFKWKGDEYQANTFLSAANLYPREVKYLASVCVPILDDSRRGCGQLERKVGGFLSMAKKASLDQVKMQLKSAIATDEDFQNTNSFDEFKKGLEKLYDYLQRGLKEEKKNIVDFLKPLDFILVEKLFFSCEQVACSEEIKFPPYLCQIDVNYHLKFRELFRTVGVRESFEVHDYIKTLQEVKHKHEENPVPKELIDKVTTVLKLLTSAMEKKDPDVKGVEAVNKYGTIFIPDSKGIMRKSTEVCVKDCIWIEDEEGVTYANEDIPSHVCITLGVKTRRQETLRRHTFGIPFGQKEKLTKRLKRILTGYPCDESIMKELLQNADDAKATKVCFIKDPRQHPDERVFEESWKPLQGPALCVYNNAPFTKSDIRGIQNLGEGNKGGDPNKTGQYGVGFNAVYHLTDAPTFISQGEEIGEVMCVFDPNLQFAPGADESSPGVMYKDLHVLRRKFPDVFPCYDHGRCFPLNDATMFRFPLRNEDMATTSKISNDAMTIQKLDNLLKDFKEELLQVLLFVNNVKEIAICEVDKETGKIIESYRVQSSLSSDDEKKRKDFAAYVSNIGKKLKCGEKSVAEIPVHQISYVVNLEDSEGLKQQWFVVQKFGFEDKEKVPGSIEDAFKRGDLGLLPRGGVASLISSSDGHQDVQGKAFCFLPLPFKTGLPVHVNGHFALNHEDRRSLWRDDKGTYRRNWNEALLQQVVAPCYVTLLDEVRQLISLPRNDDGKTLISGDRDDGESVIANYFKYFPSFAIEEEYWKILTTEVYRYMNARSMRLLPVLREESFEENQRQKGVRIEWLPPTGDGRDKAVFGSLLEKLPSDYDTLDEDKKIKAVKNSKRLRNTVLGLGMNLLCTPPDYIDIYDCFIKAGVDVSFIAPKGVIDFFSTYNSSDQLCNVGNLPLPISQTPFRNMGNLLRVLKYCKQCEEFLQRLEGLPLLVTQDEVLRVFSQSDTIFPSGYYDVLPHCSSMFVHRNLLNEVFHFHRDAKRIVSPVFKVFNVKAFANLLPKEMNENVYRRADGGVIWDPGDENRRVPGRQWICHLWRFFSNNIGKRIKKYDEEQNSKRKYPLDHDERRKLEELHEMQDKEARKRITKEALNPVMNWCLLPAFEAHPGVSSATVKHILLPVAISSTVIELGSSMAVDFKEMLKKLALPQLHCYLIDGESSSVYVTKPSETAKRLVATLEEPKSVLTVLLKKMTSDPDSFKALQPVDSLHVLGYFNTHLSQLNPSTAEELKRLPLYETIHDDIISISGKQAYVLPSRIPKDEMHIWEETSGIAFLKESISLKKLHEFLSCDSKDEVDVYCDIIFDKFEDMSQQARIKHVTFVREALNRLERDVLISSDEKKSKVGGKLAKLSQALSKMKFMTAQDGTLKTASSFYDPTNNVFAAMFKNNQEMFPPHPFRDSEEWLPFLRRIGLIHEVTNEQFVQFAKEVETEARTSPDDGTREKSEALVTCLFESEDIASSMLLDDVEGICFIFPQAVHSNLQAIHEQYGPGNTGSPCICFRGSVASKNHDIAWTTANFLPDYASPFYHENRDLTKQEQKQVAQRLGILPSPTIEMVLTHCKNICNVLNQMNATESSPRKESKKDSQKIVTIMTNMYKYLERKYDGNERVINELKDVRCLVVDEGKRFVFPNQVSTDITLEQEIPPYLYKIPLKVATSEKLFINLGTTNTVTAAQYSMVLRSIHDESGKKLHPNAIHDAFKATKGFFETFVKDDVHVTEITPLYLPGVKQNPSDPSMNKVFLRTAGEILYNDAPHLKERLGQFNELILVKLAECGLRVNNEDLVVKKLPESIRPRMLTSVVHETLMDDDVQHVTCSSTAQELRQVLTSRELCHGIIRLIKHADYQSDAETSTDIPPLVQERLRCIRVYSVPNLRTRLVYNGRAIPESEAEVCCFEEETEEENKKVWKIYIEKDAELSNFDSLLAEIIDRIMSNYLKKMIVHLPKLLSSKPFEMKRLLDGLKIREDNSELQTKAAFLPTPGNFIHISDHHLLVDDFTVFSPGEYVGYELDDPSLRGEDGTPTYIYAVVIEEVIEDGQPSNLDPTLRKYRIDIGKDKEPIVVDAADLYKFYRPKQENSECLELELFTGTPDHEKKPANLDEAQKEIRRILDEDWKLPEEKRKKIIKRLFLKWHPDKNPGNEQFCTEVFKFIQQEIQRLEEGLPVKPRDAPIPRKESEYSNSGYTSFFTSWSGRAKTHKRQSSSFHSAGGFSTWNSSSAHRSNPQPGEARRWYEQAEADLEAASNDVLHPERTSYEWACFKCHQSAEKALKAAQYSIDADKTNVHNLRMIALDLNNATLSTLASELESLVGDSTRMRYPDRLRYPEIPNSVYTSPMASEAIRLAAAIVQEVKSKFID